MDDIDLVHEEVALILFMMNKEYFNKYYSYIFKLNVEAETKRFLKTLDSYFKEHDVEHISVEEFITYFVVKHPALRVRKSYKLFMEKLGSVQINSKVLEENLNNILEKYFASEMIMILTDALDGTKYNILSDVQSKIEEFESIKYKISKDDDELFVTSTLSELLDEEVRSDGLRWRLSCLNEGIGELSGASLGHVFARVDTGKTSFLVSEATHFASQLTGDEIILWCNNEEKGTKISLRTYCSTLECTKDQLVSYESDAEQEFISRGGNRIKLYDQAIISVEDIDQLMSEHNVKLLIIDQGDKVKFSGDKEFSSVEKLKVLYGKFRELAKKYDIPIIAVGQASAAAEGVKFLQTDMMDNSKTGKPGELDYAIGIGKSYKDSDAGLESIRYISLCKNKMNNGVHGQYTVDFDSLRAIYKD